jgi:hypothetical protein
VIQERSIGEKWINSIGGVGVKVKTPMWPELKSKMAVRAVGEDKSSKALTGGVNDIDLSIFGSGLWMIKYLT